LFLSMHFVAVAETVLLGRSQSLRMAPDRLVFVRPKA
jgi:hypothetical protein